MKNARITYSFIDKLEGSCHVPKNDILAARRRLHTTVYCQCFSPCGKFLATGDSFGYIALFSLQAALSPEANAESWVPQFKFQAHDGPVYSLASTETLLISAGTGPIKSWNWTNIISQVRNNAHAELLEYHGIQDTKLCWAVEIPNDYNKTQFDIPETNSIKVCLKGGTSRLYAGCGDKCVHVWDIESGTLVQSLQGHSDYIHSIALRSNGEQCVSASEDGSVRIWDTRTAGEAIHQLEPFKSEKCARPQYGKWIGCVAVDAGDDWMVCGGGPQLSLWHLRSLECTSIYETPSTCHQEAFFYKDSVISAGNEPHVFHWSINGEMRAQVPCTPTSVFSVAINEKAENTKVMSISGSSYKLDICTNFGYKAFSMSVC